MRGGKRENAGRKPGSPNKATADIKAIAQDYGERAITRLVEIMEGKDFPPAAQVSAAKELLDRGYGKAAQHMHLDGGLDIQGIKRVIVDPANPNPKGVRSTP